MYPRSSTSTFTMTSDFHVDKVTPWGAGNFCVLMSLSIGDKGSWRYRYGAVWAGTSVREGVRWKCACMQVGQRGKGRPSVGRVSSELGWIGKSPHSEALRPPLCLCRKLQQSSLPPALPVADVAWKHLDGLPAHGDYREGLLWPPNPHVSWWPDSGLWGPWYHQNKAWCYAHGKKRKTIFVQNRTQVSGTSWDKDGRCLLSSWRKIWARSEVTKSLANTRGSGTVC